MSAWEQLRVEVEEYGGGLCGRAYRAATMMSEPAQMALERMTARALTTVVDAMRASA